MRVHLSHLFSYLFLETRNNSKLFYMKCKCLRSKISYWKYNLLRLSRIPKITEEVEKKRRFTYSNNGKYGDVSKSNRRSSDKMNSPARCDWETEHSSFIVT